MLDKDHTMATVLADWWCANLRKQPSANTLATFHNALVDGFTQAIVQGRPHARWMFLTGFDGGPYGPVLPAAVRSVGDDLLIPYRAGVGVYLDAVEGDRIEARCGWHARPAVIWKENR